VLGIFLTFIVYHSGSIYTSVACHFINNLISALAVFIYGADSFDAGEINDMTSSEQAQFVILGTISLIVFIIIIILIKKYSVIKNFPKQIPPLADE
jgi:hypothetical protein